MPESAPARPDFYTPHIGSEFTLHLEGGLTRSLTLAAVKPTIDDETQLCFSLLFTGAGETLIQKIHPVSHPALGAFGLFLVPVRQKRNGIAYEAVFNLLKDDVH